MLARPAAGPRAWIGLSCLMVCACLAGCGTSPAPTGTLPAQPPAPSSRGAVPTSGQQPSQPTAQSSADDIAADETLIHAADASNPATLDALPALRFTSAGAQAAADVLAQGGSADVVWAALWIYASSGVDPAPVVTQLTNSDPSDAALAAGVLTGLGGQQGLGAIRHVLDEDGQMRNAEPPLSLRGYAVETLAEYVSASDAPVAPAAGDDVAAAAAWATWLDANAAALKFDAENGAWVGP